MRAQISNVMQKEFLDAVRDRRSLMASFAVAIIGPLMIFTLLTTLAKNTERDNIITTAVVGYQQAPTLVDWLEQRAIKVQKFETEDAALEAMGPELLTTIYFTPDYQKKYLAGSTAEIRIYADYKRDAARTNARRLDRLMTAYGRQVEQARLIARGVSPTRINALDVKQYDLSSVGGGSVQFSGMLSYLFLMACFISGAFMAADSVAGERERHSLQSLLSQPVTSFSLILGKWFVAIGISGLVATITIIFGGTLLGQAPLAQLGLRFFTDPITLILGALILLPLCAVATALQLMVAARAKTYREAATYTQYTTFIPVLLLVLTQFSNIELGEITNYLPVIGQDYALRELLLEGSAPFLPMLGSAALTVAIAVIFIIYTSYIISSEKFLN